MSNYLSKSFFRKMYTNLVLGGCEMCLGSNRHTSQSGLLQLPATRYVSASAGSWTCLACVGTVIETC